ncbi:MAG: DNA-binding protein [Nitrososphaeraceae archaeon]
MSQNETKINQLKPGMRGVNVQAKVDSISEPRTVNLRNGGTAQVADAQVSDETGTIKLSLWDDQINAVSEGDMVSVENGYTHAFRGETNLNIGKYGTLKKT